MKGKATRLAAKQALESIPGMGGAHLREPISDGPSNTSFAVEHEGRHLVLRLDKSAAMELGLDRLNEKRVSHVTAEAGLTPQTLYFEPAAGISLRFFQPGRSWVAADLQIPANLQRLAALVRKLHILEPVGAPFRPVTAARLYADRLGSPEGRRALRRMESLSEQIHAGPHRRALCHNDLVCQNVIESDRLLLIDWEYAGIGDPFFDLAVIVQHHGLVQEKAHGFLEAYLQRPAISSDIEHLELQCQFYACLLDLWNAVEHSRLKSLLHRMS